MTVIELLSSIQSLPLYLTKISSLHHTWPVLGVVPTTASPALPVFGAPELVKRPVVGEGVVRVDRLYWTGWPPQYGGRWRWPGVVARVSRAGPAMTDGG